MKTPAFVRKDIIDIIIDQLCKKQNVRVEYNAPQRPFSVQRL